MCVFNSLSWFPFQRQGVRSEIGDGVVQEEGGDRLLRHSSWIRMRINWSGFGDYTGKRIWE